MENKSLGLLTLGILSLLVFTAFASAVTVNPTSLTLSSFNTTRTFSVTNDGDSVLTLTSPIIISDNQDTQNQVTITLNDTSIAAGQTETITATLGDIPSDFSLGTFSTTYTVSAGVTLKLEFQNTPNEYVDNGNLNIDDVSLSVEKGFGPEDNEWYPFDEITAEVDVVNDGDEKIKSIKVQWGLYNAENGKWIVKGKEDSFSLDDGDDTTLTINFQIDSLSKIDVDNDNYKFYIWANGDDDGTDTSTYYSEDITLVIDDDFVILDNLLISETASCGSEVQVTADVWNIGADDQDDVYIRVYNKELGLNQKVIVGDIDSFDSEEVDFTITLPQDAQGKTYDLEFSVRENNGEVYQNDNDDESKLSKEIVIGGSCSVTPTASVSAILESEKAIAGKELIIKTVIGNTGSKTSTFNVELSDYTAWASLENIDKTSVTLDAGESEEVLIKLKISQDSLGDKNFNVVITEDGKTLTQPVSVNVEKSTGLLTGMFSGLAGDNWYLWGIGALNVLLILVIIIVAVKVTRKKE